jgi:hypothetical protein
VVPSLDIRNVDGAWLVALDLFEQLDNCSFG